MALRDQRIDDQDQRIAELKAELAAKEGLEQRVAAQEQRIAELEAKLAIKNARIADLEREVAELKKAVATLMDKLGRNSRNSHLPPSSDGPGGRSKDVTTPRSGKSGKRKRGAQHGHRGSRRTLLPAEQVDDFVDLYPEQCESCWRELPKVPDPHATRYQVTEIPPMVPRTKEYRRHAVTCACGFTTRAQVEGVVPTSPFGPRLMSLVARCSPRFPSATAPPGSSAASCSTTARWSSSTGTATGRER